jgi:membrane-bound lytic murein transglycosylase MltF
MTRLVRVLAVLAISLVSVAGFCAGERPSFTNVLAGLASTAQIIPKIIPAPAPSVPRGTTIPHRIPERCYQWQRQLTKEAHTVFGLAAPVPVLAAQIEAESACRPDVHSAYAVGLTEFTPETAADMAARYPDVLAPAAPGDPRWAIAAQVRYMHELTSPDRAARTPCDRWAFGFSAYNGGDGWVRRDQRLCTASGKGCDWQQWFSNVEFHTARGGAAALENRTYVRRILLDYAPGYSAWGQSIACTPS